MASGRPMRSTINPRRPGICTDSSCWRSARRSSAAPRSTWRSTIRARRSRHASTVAANRTVTRRGLTLSRVPAGGVRPGASWGARCRYRLVPVEVLGHALPEPGPAARLIAAERRRRHGERRDLAGARRLQAEALERHALDSIRGPEGGSDGLETFVVGLERGDVLGLLENVVADACCVGYGCDVCDEWKHDECGGRECRDGSIPSPPTPGRLPPP